MNARNSIIVVFLTALLSGAAAAAPQKMGHAMGWSSRSHTYPAMRQSFSHSGQPQQARQAGPQPQYRSAQAPGAGHGAPPMGTRPPGSPYQAGPVPHSWQSGSGGNSVARPHPGDGLRNLRNMTPAEQQRALSHDPNFRNLPPQRQQQLLNRLQHFNSLPPERQNQLIQRVDTWNHMTPAQQQQARGLFNQMQSLPEDRRTAVRGAVRNLRAMPPEARERYLNSPEYRSKYSSQELQIMRGMTDLNVGPGAARPPVMDVPRPPQ
ncbi:MAG: DUF3106 domain-containing protein [Terriglobales bacterium]